VQREAAKNTVNPSPSSSTSTGGPLDGLLVRPWGAWLMAAVFAALGLYHLMTARFLHDEGIVSYLAGHYFLDEPIAVFFFQKLRPVAAVAHSAVAWAGLPVFLAAHVLFVSLALPLAAATARALGARWPNLAAAVIGASPLFFAAAPAGVTNADGILASCFVVYLLWARRMPLMAGLAMGAAVWVRFELLPLAAVLSLWNISNRRWWLGLLTFPAAYLAAGAAYHGVWNWFLHYPPSLPAPDASNPIWSGGGAARPWFEYAETLLAITPAVGIVLLGIRQGMRREEHALLAFAVLNAALIWGMPAFGLLNFDNSPRYAMQSLTAWALLTPFAIDRYSRQRWTSLVLAGVAGFGAWKLLEGAPIAAAPWILVGYGAVLALLALKLPRLGALAAIAALVATFAAELKTGFESQRRGSHVPMAEWLEANPDRSKGRLIYTNQHLLAPYLEHIGSPAAAQVRYILQEDQLRELYLLANPQNGQLEALRSALQKRFYGRPVFPDAVEPSRLARGSLFFLTTDPRLERVLPHAKWKPRLKVIQASERFQISEFRGANAN
jgi:hypothetical protein